MSDVSTATKYFPTVNEGFITTLGSTILSGAATVPLNSAAGLTNGTTFVGMIEPGLTKQQVFTGVVDTAGVQITGVKWTRGSNADHSAGVTIVDYVTGTVINLITTGIKKEHNDNGTHSAITATSITATTGTFTNLTVSGSAVTAGWTPLGAAPNTVTANGNRSYSLVFNSTDLTGTLSPDMRLQTTRTAAAPTQCTSLNGTNQYYSKSSPSGMTFTDDFTVSAWVKLTAYNVSNSQTISSRYNGTSGWVFGINTSGQVFLQGFNAASANYSIVNTYQSIPLNKWVHVAAQLDMSAFTATTTTSYVMLNGVDVPATVSRAGTNPTALIQAGNLEIGSTNGGTNFFTGKLAQVAVYSAKVTQSTILGTISQTLAGTETNQISAYSFNNSVADLNANANTLTAQNSAVATNADSPFGSQASGSISSTLDYSVITSATFSTNTTVVVRVPEGCTIPTTGGVSVVSYSTHQIPYGVPYITNILNEAISCIGSNTTSTTSTALLGFSCPVTLPPNREIEVELYAPHAYASGTNRVEVEIWEGTVGSGTKLVTAWAPGVNATFSAGMLVAKRRYKPSSTSITINGGFLANSAGTASLDAATTAPAYLRVRLI